MAKDTWKSDQELTGLNIKKRRKELHMTQEQLAEEMSMTKQTISKYELGQIDMGIQMLYDFADALETTPDVLAPDRFKAQSSNEARLLNSKSEIDPQLLELADIISKMDDSSKETFFTAARAMALGFSSHTDNA